MTLLKCPHCMFAFEVGKALKHHIFEDHADIPPPSKCACVFCSEEFQEVDQLRKHTITNHSI